MVILVMLCAMAMNIAVAQGPNLDQAKPAKGKKQRVEPSYAWSVSDPLGLHYPSTIDTLFLDYHRTMVPSLVSDAWLTTGNYGAPGQNQIFFERPTVTGEFFFEDAIEAWNTRVERTCRIVPHGYCIANGEETSCRCWSCSGCSYGWHISDYDRQYLYCPNCGAKVVE